MFKIVRTLPGGKTRLPFAAWALAGLVTLFSIVTSLMQVRAPIVQAAEPITAHYASMTDLLNLFGALQRPGLNLRGGRPSGRLLQLPAKHPPRACTHKPTAKC